MKFFEKQSTFMCPVFSGLVTFKVPCTHSAVFIHNIFITAVQKKEAEVKTDRLCCQLNEKLWLLRETMHVTVILL